VTVETTTPFDSALGAARVDGGCASPRGRRDVVADEPELAERFARGEAAALDEVVARYQPAVARLARRLLGWSAGADAEDIVQEVFVAALKGATRFRRGASLGTWLTTITLNKCRSHRRGLLARLRLMAGLGRRPGERVAAAADVAAGERDGFVRVQSAMQGLSAREREVIVLHYLEEKPAAQIAELLGIRTGAAEVRLSRARARLREILGVEPVEKR
jgi:RNA polymerase sigma-70 factor (ECF subfamily)